MKRIFLYINFQCLLKVFIPVSLVAASCANNALEKQPGAVSKIDTFTCPMHPTVIRTGPGSCPICNMALVKKENVSYEATQVDLSTLLRPTNTYVISQIPVTTMEQTTKPITIEALGRVEYDTRYVSTISAKVSGRIEKLYVKYRYEHIHQGHPVMDIYSPELVTAQQQLLFLVKSDPGNIALINSAKEKLLLLGLSNDQLQQVIRSGKVKQAVTVYSNHTGHIHQAMGMQANSTEAPSETQMTSRTEELPIKEGMYVEKGQAVFWVYNTDNSWVSLNLFADQASLVKVGMPVSLIPETAPGKMFQGKIGFIEPFYRSNSKTNTARVYFDNTMLQIPIGSQVKAKMQVTSSKSDWLPRDAVLSLGLNNVVLVKQNNGFKVHPVQVGIVAGNEIQILNGLTVEDSIAANAQFLMDSESFIKTK